MKFVIALILAAASTYGGYQAVLWYYPHKLMAYTYTRWNPGNQWFHAGRQNPQTTWVPGGNPDFIISRAAYDVSKGPILLTGVVPPETYWSLTGYQGNGANFFIRNDAGRSGQVYEFVLAKMGIDVSRFPQAANREVLYSPTDRGLLVVRIFLTNKVDYTTLKSIQEKAVIQPLANRHSA